MSDQQQPPQQHPSDKHDDASRVVVLVVGAILVLVGLVFLGRQWLWPGWFPVSITGVLDTIRGLGWGLGLIIIGVLVILLSQRKGFKPPAKGARLYRSRTNRMVAGVFGGLGEYLSMDVTLIRLVYAGLALLFDVWPAVFAYVVAVIIVPEEPEAQALPTPVPVAPVPGPSAAPPAPPVPPAPPTPLASPPIAPADAVESAPQPTDLVIDDAESAPPAQDAGPADE